jgi:NAD(P)-dependent dehydrogenase (short-subunit alcohol dehydrogenase family)
MSKLTFSGIGLGLCQALAESGADVVSLQLPTEPTEIKVDVVPMLSNPD